MVAVPTNLARMLDSTSQTWGDAGVLGVALQGVEMGVAAAVEADDGEVDAIIGACDLRVAFCGGRNCRSGYREGSAIDEGATRDHLFSPCRFLDAGFLQIGTPYLYTP